MGNFGPYSSTYGEYVLVIGFWKANPTKTPKGMLFGWFYVAKNLQKAFLQVSWLLFTFLGSLFALQARATGKLKQLKGPNSILAAVDLVGVGLFGSKNKLFCNCLLVFVFVFPVVGSKTNQYFLPWCLFVTGGCFFV